MLSTYENNSYGTPKERAQRALCGRTHYVDDDTLRFHKSRILSAVTVDNGLLLAIVESCALDMNNTRRGYRYVVFDVTGRVVSRVDLDDCWKTKAPATRAMWAFLNECDAKAITREALERQRRDLDYSAAEIARRLELAA